MILATPMYSVQEIGESKFCVLSAHPVAFADLLLARFLHTRALIATHPWMGMTIGRLKSFPYTPSTDGLGFE
jgi:hypothetical protein